MSQCQVAGQPGQRNGGLGMFPRLQRRGVRPGWAHLLFSSPTEGEARNHRIGSISPQMLPAPFTHYHWWIIEDSPNLLKILVLSECAPIQYRDTNENTQEKKLTQEYEERSKIKLNLRCHKCILSPTAIGQGTTTVSVASNRRDVTCWSILYNMLNSHSPQKRKWVFSLSQCKRKQQAPQFCKAENPTSQFWFNTIFYSTPFTFFSARGMSSSEALTISPQVKEEKKNNSSSLKLQPINYGVATCPKCDFHTVRRIFHTIIDYLRL